MVKLLPRRVYPEDWMSAQFPLPQLLETRRCVWWRRGFLSLLSSPAPHPHQSGEGRKGPTGPCLHLTRLPSVRSKQGFCQVRSRVQRVLPPACFPGGGGIYPSSRGSKPGLQTWLLATLASPCFPLLLSWVVIWKLKVLGAWCAKAFPKSGSQTCWLPLAAPGLEQSRLLRIVGLFSCGGEWGVRGSHFARMPSPASELIGREKGEFSWGWNLPTAACSSFSTAAHHHLVACPLPRQGRRQAVNSWAPLSGGMVQGVAL